MSETSVRWNAVQILEKWKCSSTVSRRRQYSVVYRFSRQVCRCPWSTKLAQSQPQLCSFPSNWVDITHLAVRSNQILHASLLSVSFFRRGLLFWENLVLPLPSPPVLGSRYWPPPPTATGVRLSPACPEELLPPPTATGVRLNTDVRKDSVSHTPPPPPTSSPPFFGRTGNFRRYVS